MPLPANFHDGHVCIIGLCHVGLTLEAAIEGMAVGGGR